MAVQLTVIGLGQIGLSMGLALAGREELIYRVGHDREPQVMNKAKALGAFDATFFNLPASVEKADVVALCLPLDQVEETLRLIAPDLREGAVVLDTSPSKAIVAGWFEKLVPPGRYYVGLVPSINPLMLENPSHGGEAARADLFDKATIGVTSPEKTPTEAVKLAEDLIALMGGTPLFMDLLEADGMMTAAHLLPQVMSVALLNATVAQPGWGEARRFAGRPYALASSAIGDDTLAALGQALLANAGQSAYTLNLAIGALTHLRDALVQGDAEDVQKRLRLALEDRANWMRERKTAIWDADEAKPRLEPGNFIQRLFLGSRPKSK